MDSYIWTHQCWPTSKKLYSSTLCGNWVSSTWLTKIDSNGWRERERERERESQRNPFCWLYLMNDDCLVIFAEEQAIECLRNITTFFSSFSPVLMILLYGWSFIITIIVGYPVFVNEFLSLFIFVSQWVFMRENINRWVWTYT